MMFTSLLHSLELAIQLNKQRGEAAENFHLELPLGVNTEIEDSSVHRVIFEHTTIVTD